MTDASEAFSPSGAMPMPTTMQTSDRERTTASDAIPGWLPAMPPPPPGPPAPVRTPPPAEVTLTDAIPLQNPGPKAFRWALGAVVGILALTEGLSRLFVWLGHNFRSGTAPAFLTGAALLLLTPALIFVAVRAIAVGRVGLSPFGMGLRRPASITDAAILGAAVWFCFLLFAASWVVLTTPKDQLDDRGVLIEHQDGGSTVPVSVAPDTGSGVASDATGGTNDPTASVPRAGSSTNDESSLDFPATDLEPAKPVATHDDRHVLLKVLGDHPPRRVLILILIATCLAAPIFEELFFRGFLFRAFAGRFGPIPAMVITGSLFGLAHVMVVPLRMTVPLGVMGIALAWLLQQTRSLVPGMVVHGFVNALGAGVSAGFGMHTATLIVGTWFLLMLLLLPWLRRPVVATRATP